MPHTHRFRERPAGSRRISDLLWCRVRFHPPNTEAVLDGEQAKGPLLLGREMWRGHEGRNELRLFDPARVPFIDDGGGPARKYVLEPIRIRPVGQRDQEPIIGREGLHRRFVGSARCPADVSDH